LNHDSFHPQRERISWKSQFNCHTNTVQSGGTQACALLSIIKTLNKTPYQQFTIPYQGKRKDRSACVALHIDCIYIPRVYTIIIVHYPFRTWRMRRAIRKWVLLKRHAMQCNAMQCNAIQMPCSRCSTSPNLSQTGKRNRKCQNSIAPCYTNLFIAEVHRKCRFLPGQITHASTEMKCTHLHSQFKVQHRPAPLCKVRIKCVNQSVCVVVFFCSGMWISRPDISVISQRIAIFLCAVWQIMTISSFVCILESMLHFYPPPLFRSWFLRVVLMSVAFSHCILQTNRFFLSQAGWIVPILWSTNLILLLHGFRRWFCCSVWPVLYICRSY